MKWRKSVRLKEQLDFVASVTDSRAQKIFAAHTHIYWIWLDSKLFCCQTQVANAMEIWTKSVAVVYRWVWASIWSSNCFVRSESPVHLMNGRKGERFFFCFLFIRFSSLENSGEKYEQFVTQSSFLIELPYTICCCAGANGQNINQKKTLLELCFYALCHSHTANIWYNSLLTLFCNFMCV